MKFVDQCNSFARQKAGGQKPPPSVPRIIGEKMSCIICVSRGTCLGKSCLGDNGELYFHQLTLNDSTNLSVFPKVENHPRLISQTDELMGQEIPGCQASSLCKSRYRRKKTKTLRFV